ncbi:ids2p [Saccharomyces arboricola H-6]|uniref:Ids2p n=1 Tax=Saccharomyces arboricola (strain H-6 / AS 2.3317 / CBS 10644) TaxID=1160507 RepID=J8Q6L3_SACAR|nr:ids2p [Saccharomyces arboricola H-6]
MDNQQERISEDITGDLAAAVRKSWSESQDNPLFLNFNNSPIGTPTDRYSPESMMMMEGNQINPPSLARDSAQQQQRLYGSSQCREKSEQQQQDYQLFKHHYSLGQETRESVSDILNDLTLGSPEPSERISPIRQPSVDAPPLTTRRSSIQDVQWIRHLLNPRSSFSGVSANEPTSSSNEFPNQNRAWITILHDSSAESLQAVIVLAESLKKVSSQYSLWVLHPSEVSAFQLTQVGIKTLAIDKYINLFLNFGTDSGFSESLQATATETKNDLNFKWCKLFLFFSLIDRFELICYLSPTCMVLQNIDELLETPEVSDEIDNETCVLLSNKVNYINGDLASVEHDRNNNAGYDDEPQIIILKPNSAVAMCIKEYFTIYGNDFEGESKRSMFHQLNDLQIMKALFGDKWSYIGGGGYCAVPVTSIPASNLTYKIIDFKILKPWERQNYIDAGQQPDSIINKWLDLWRDFLNQAN